MDPKSKQIGKTKQEKDTHAQINSQLNARLHTFMPSRGLFKAVVRNIPSFLSKDEFYLGLNVSLPVNQWYFHQSGSQPTSAFVSQSGGRNYSLLGSSAEYSVAYFGFDDKEVLSEFIRKYNNFVVEVDHKRKYVLQVTKAIFQDMPVLSSLTTESESLEGTVTETDDFKEFVASLGKAKEQLLPLELQLQKKREQEQKLIDEFLKQEMETQNPQERQELLN